MKTNLFSEHKWSVPAFPKEKYYNCVQLLPKLKTFPRRILVLKVSSKISEIVKHSLKTSRCLMKWRLRFRVQIWCLSGKSIPKAGACKVAFVKVSYKYQKIVSKIKECNCTSYTSNSPHYSHLFHEPTMPSSKHLWRRQHHFSHEGFIQNPEWRSQAGSGYSTAQQPGAAHEHSFSLLGPVRAG